LSRVEVRLGELVELIDDLLALAAAKTKVLEEPLRPVPLGPIFQRVIDRLAPMAESKQVALRVGSQLDDRAATVWATDDGLDKVLSNLIGNAIKYTPAGGSVCVEAAGGPGPLKLTVSDSGLGIPAEALPHIWDEFFRARNVREAGISGTGLGLSIVRHLVEYFGGQIEVRNRNGQGTTFTLTLRLVSKEAP
jgi:signal transduction histidine kinase